MKIRRALISVTDKTGLVPFAKGLRRLGVEIVSTGGTLKLLRENNIKAQPIEEFTGFPEMFDGRLKTLHPKVHGGLLMVRGDRAQQRDAKKYGIEPIDLVVVNLYKFEEATRDPKLSERAAVEYIDIGGPTMLRSAAKNYEHVGVVSNPEDYEPVLKEIKARKGRLSRTTCRLLAAKVFRLTHTYDRAISNFFAKGEAATQKTSESAPLPDTLTLTFEKAQELRYGENPHQRGAYYVQSAHDKGKFTQHQGKELSFNNILDMESALELIQEFSDPAAVVIKHNNPCGVAEGKDLAAVVRDAIDGDPTSAFGGIIAVNRRLTHEAAIIIFEKLPFFEILIAPAFDKEALAVFASRKNLRVIETDPKQYQEPFALRFGTTGLLLQDRDRSLRGLEAGMKKNLKVVTKVKPDVEDIRSLIFAWKVAKHVKSNAIVLVKGTKTVGIGAGQMSRIDSVRIACDKAASEAEGSVMASDGFFPMADNIDMAHQHGIRMIIQPGGSIRDAEVIEASNRYGIGMVLTGKRHFRH